MRAFCLLFLSCFLTCNLVQSKHFLVETEDNSAERFESDDYADNNTLTDKDGGISQSQDCRSSGGCSLAADLCDGMTSDECKDKWKDVDWTNIPINDNMPNPIDLIG